VYHIDFPSTLDRWLPAFASENVQLTKPLTGTGACSLCPNGTRSGGGSDNVTACICVEGYTAGSDGVECTACEAGTYKDWPGTGAVSNPAFASLKAAG